MEELRKLAREHVERYLGDACDPDDDPEVIEDNVYILAYEAIIDAGASMVAARQVAMEISKEMA
jgi:hypothetical protein